MHRYQIWYIPRIQDELAIAHFEVEDKAHDAMNYLKHNRPKAYPHHYIWDSKTKKKIEVREYWDEFGWWGS